MCKPANSNGTPQRKGFTWQATKERAPYTFAPYWDRCLEPAFQRHEQAVQHAAAYWGLDAAQQSDLRRQGWTTVGPWKVAIHEAYALGTRLPGDR